MMTLQVFLISCNYKIKMNVILGVMEVVFDVLTARECLQNRAVAPAMETFLQTDLNRLVLNFTLKTCSFLNAYIKRISTKDHKKFSTCIERQLKWICLQVTWQNYCRFIGYSRGLLPSTDCLFFRCRSYTLLNFLTESENRSTLYKKI